MGNQLDIHLWTDGPTKPPHVWFVHVDPAGDEECFESGMWIPQIRPFALPALVQELTFLCMRHGPLEGQAFLRRMESAGQSLPEPTLF